jgi:hypothetical protein
MSAIHDDIKEYEALCKKYGESVQYKAGSPDCYGAHAADLEKRFAAERKQAKGAIMNETLTGREGLFDGYTLDGPDYVAEP